jgi:hypothetical protein
VAIFFEKQNPITSGPPLFRSRSAHTASPTHYLSFKSGLPKKVSAHTASPTHYLSFKSGLLKKVSALQTLFDIRKPKKKQII